jgi:chaperone modulatory protein CbpM
MTLDEFCQVLEIEQASLQVWIDEGWLRQRTGAPEDHFTAGDISDVDLARARLIRHLLDDMGVNPEGVGIILDLIDQVHGLRGALREAAGSLRSAD